MRGSSAGDTEAGLRSWRLRFGDFFSRMWFLFWLRRLSLPEPVRLKRACAPLCVFILGMSILRPVILSSLDVDDLSASGSRLVTRLWIVDRLSVE